MKSLSHAQLFATPWIVDYQALRSLSVHGIFQTRILEWVAISFSRGSSQPRDWTQFSCTEGRCFTIWATREAFSKYKQFLKSCWHSSKIHAVKFFNIAYWTLTSILNHSSASIQKAINRSISLTSLLILGFIIHHWFSKNLLPQKALLWRPLTPWLFRKICL